MFNVADNGSADINYINMTFDKYFAIKLKDDTQVYVSLTIQGINMQSIDDSDFAYEFDDAGLSEQQICEAEEYINANINNWVELTIAGEDIEDCECIH